MKKIILATSVVFSLVFQGGFVSAQSTFDYNYDSGTTYDYNYGSSNTYDYNYGSGNTYDYNYASGNTYDYNYTAPQTGTTYDYNYGVTLQTGTTYDYNYSSVLGGSGITSPSYTYTPGYTYTSPTTYGSSYSYPTVGNTSYGGTSYGGINYGYSNYGYSAPSVSWTGYNYGSTYVAPPVTTTIQTIQCWNGTVIPNTQTCPAQPTTPTQCSYLSDSYTTRFDNNYPTCTKLCSNGTTIAGNQLCPSTVVQPPIYTPPTINYQTCWDGSVIPTTSVCSSQYKVCANGTSIPIYQTCYYGNTYVPYVPPQTTKFNSVITSIATQVTMNSGRCNGIGLIANNAQSTGWFEYGETASLGRTTASSAIGNSSSAPFSNLLSNLKANTKYYCRAVMQNQYGIVKGDIVSFTTKSKSVTYVKPVTTTIKTVVKPVVKKTEIICIDGSIVSVGSQSSATLINKGEKLVALQMVKTNGSLSAGNSVSYNLSYKNLSDSRLTGVVIKVTIPQEITNVSSSVGNYDEASHMLTLNQDTIDAYTEGVITWTGKVVKDAPVGKSIVTTAYVVYTVPGTSVQDEVTAYVVGSIIPATTTTVDTGAKNVIGASERGFLPNSLVEWLALIAIFFIIYILGRSIYSSYKEER